MPNSAWTETGSSISLAPSTIPVSVSSSPEDVNYLSNSDKITLMAQYSAELATKTSLDTTAASLGISSATYDTAVAAINTTLVNAGAPANWATIWPDGLTFGPASDIQGMLANDWEEIASHRAALQSAIGSAQAEAAQSAATSAAATDATTKMNAAITAAQNLSPAVVSALPTLPSSTYPAGRLIWDTTDGQLYRSTGSAWTVLKVSAPNIGGTLAAAQIATVTAAQVTGQLSDAQIAALAAAKLTGQITGTQITDGAVSTGKLAAGAVTASQIAADTITASQIAAGAITSSELATGAVIAGKIAAGTVQAGDIAAATITGDKIAANTVTAGNIAANTITAGQIASDTITAGQIAAGAIGAGEIAAGAITTAALTVANFDNLIPNPNSEQAAPAGGWPAGAYEGAALSTDSPHTGTHCRATHAQVFITPYIPVNPGDQFYYSCWAKAATGDTAMLAFDFLAADTSYSGGSYPTTTNTSYAQLSGNFTIPANVAFVHVSIECSSGTGIEHFDDFYFRRMADANLIVDGSITASKIAAGAITADMIRTGTLDAALVTVENINASNITTGTLSASKVLFADGTAITTAARVQTDVVNAAPFGANGAITTPQAITGFGWSLPALGPNDVFNVTATVSLNYPSNTTVTLCVDGNTATDYILARVPTGNLLLCFASITGLSAGTHTIQFYLTNRTTPLATDGTGSAWGMCQRIY